MAKKLFRSGGNLWKIDAIFYVSGTSEERDMSKEQGAEQELYMNAVLVIGNMATNVP